MNKVEYNRRLHNEEDGRLVVLLPERDGAEEARKTGMLEDLFLPLGQLPPRYFRGARIGLIDNPETMLIDHITLY